MRNWGCRGSTKPIYAFRSKCPRDRSYEYCREVLSAVVQIAANYGGTLTQPTDYFNNPVTTGDAIVVFVSWLSTDGYVVSVTDNQSNLYLAVDPIQVGGVNSSQT